MFSHAEGGGGTLQTNNTGGCSQCLGHTGFAPTHSLMAESEEELKNLLIKMKEESEKVDLKLNIQKTKIMASSPIISCRIGGETVEIVSDFIFWGLPNHCKW